MTILAWKIFSSNQMYTPVVKHHNFLKGSSIIWALELINSYKSHFSVYSGVNPYLG